MKQIAGGVCAATGFSASGVHCGIRKNKTKRDLALIYSSVPASAAAVYTTNLVKGAPLVVTKQHLADGKAQAIICNSGNANTCNADGVAVAEERVEGLPERYADVYRPTFAVPGLRTAVSNSVARSGAAPAGAEVENKGQFYQYPHDYPNHYVEQQYLPDALVGTVYYQFGENKNEDAARKYREKLLADVAARKQADKA